MKAIASSSPPNTSITAFPIYFSDRIRIAKARTIRKILFDALNKGSIIGEVIASIKFGTAINGTLSSSCWAKNNEDLEKALKKNSKKDTIKTINATYIV